MATSNYDDPYVMEDSDQESGQDSEDEISQWLGTSTEQKKHSKRRDVGQISDSSEDEFEKLMDSEINSKIRSEFPQMEGIKSKKQQEEEQNDSLFYDPSLDDADQDWVNKKRASYHPFAPPTQSNNGKNNPRKTDAVLNCPACMCAVCLDCQRLKSERDDANDRAEKLKQTLTDCQEQLAAAEAERDELHRKIQTLEGENYSLQENLSSATNKIEEHKQKEKDFEEMVNGLGHKVSMLEKTEDDCQTQLSKLTDRLQAAEEASASNESEMKGLRADNEKLEQDLVGWEDKYKTMQDHLRSAMADLNNV